MACKNPDAPCPGCHKAKAACARDILQDLFDDLMALAPMATVPAHGRDAPRRHGLRAPGLTCRSAQGPARGRRDKMTDASPKPCIICVAITGSLPTKANNPAVPISVAEQVESTQEAFEAGASIAHCHVRNDDGTPSSDPETFARLLEGLRKHWPGLIVQFSTGGRSGAGQSRGGMLPLRPDMASLSVGSNNFPTRVYENPPDLVDWLAAEMRKYRVKPEVEAFDLSHIHQAVAMNLDGRIPGRLYVQFVMGVKNAMPADRDVFDYYIRTLERLAPEAEWCAAGIGSSQIVLNEWSVAAGGHARTGLEDNVRLDRDRLAPSNAALVRRVVELCDRYGRPVADWRQARDMLGLTTAVLADA